MQTPLTISTLFSETLFAINASGALAISVSGLWQAVVLTPRI